MSAILSERVAPNDSTIIASRVKLLKTGVSANVVVPSLPVVNSIICGAAGSATVNGSAYDEYAESAQKLLSWYPTVPHPLLISVLNNTKGDSEKAINLLNQILALSQQEEDQYHGNHSNQMISCALPSNRNSGNARTIDTQSNNHHRKNSLQSSNYEENRKRWRSEPSFASNTINDVKILSEGLRGVAGSTTGSEGFNNGDNPTITEEELRNKHSIITNDVVSLIIEQSNGDLMNADNSLNKLVHETLDSNTDSSIVCNDKSAELRHTCGVNLMSISTTLDDNGPMNEHLETKYNRIMNVLLGYEKELMRLDSSSSPDIAKCLARSVISQNDKLNLMTTKLSEVEQQLTESNEQRDKMMIQRDELQSQCEQLLGIIQQLQNRIVSNERGNTLFFNSFHGPPPGSCY